MMKRRNRTADAGNGMLYVDMLKLHGGRWLVNERRHPRDPNSKYDPRSLSRDEVLKKYGDNGLTQEQLDSYAPDYSFTLVRSHSEVIS